MDTPLEKANFKQKLIKNWKQIAKYSIFLFLGIWLIRFFSGHQVDKEQLRIATVKRGDLISQVEASGTVKVSGLISFYSPIDSYIKDVFKREGHYVEQGDTLLTIDSSELDKSILEIRNKIRISQNNLKTKEIEFQILQVNNKKNKELFESNKEKHTQQVNVAKKLKKIGAISDGDVLVRKAELKKDNIDLKYLAKTQNLQQERLQQEIATLRLTIEISRNEYRFLLKHKEQCVLVAKQAGAVSKQAFLGGEKLQKGQLIAQVSNLKDFIVEAQISQRQVDRVHLGQACVIRINDRDYQAKLSLLQPELKNGYGIAELSFEKGQKLQLKQNQRAQVFIQTGFKKNTLVVERGAFLSAGGRFAFKVEHGLAKKVAINTGGRNYSLVEILSGLKEGDEIIVSQIASFIDWDEFKIN